MVVGRPPGVLAGMDTELFTKANSELMLCVRLPPPLPPPPPPLPPLPELPPDPAEVLLLVGEVCTDMTGPDWTVGTFGALGARGAPVVFVLPVRATAPLLSSSPLLPLPPVGAGPYCR